MGWNGSGTHNRVHNFSADASAGIQAQAVRFDAEFDDVSTALENCQTLDGQTTPTANSPMGGFKHTGVAAATSTDNYLRADQSSNQVGIFVRDTNTGLTGTMSASASPFPTSLTEGQRITVKVSANGSAAAPRAIIVNGLSANIIDNAGSAILASKMLKDGYFDLVYDASASAWRTLTPRNDTDLDALTSTGTFIGSITGVSTSATGSITFTIAGGICALGSNAKIAGASSNTTGMTITGLPTALQPVRGVQCACLVRDSSTDYMGIGAIGSAGSTITFSFSSAGPVGASNFTAAGEKGVPSGWSFIYRVD